MRKRHTPEQVVQKLREAEADLANGLTLGQVGQKLAVSEPTYHRWQARYGGLQGDDARRLKEREAEHVRLKRLVAEPALDKQLPREAARKTF
jgi:putative transposase